VKLQSKDKIETIKNEDDTLFGLLSIYKIYNTYFRILLNEENNNLLFQITGNPKKWPKIEEKYANYRQLKRSEIGMIKLSVKYLLPEHLIEQLGTLLGIKVPENEVSLSNNLDTDGFYSMEIKSKYLPEIISALEKILNLSPERKYEILEKSFSK
jgi:hypothetical protein